MTGPRDARLFTRYRLSGSTLPFDTWVKHDKVAVLVWAAVTTGGLR